MSKEIKKIELDTHLIQNQNEEINLSELASVIWLGKWKIMFITVLFTAFASLYAITQPNIYHSEVLLFPAETESNGGLSSLAGQFGGLASLAGVNLGGQKSNKTELAIEVLKSRKFTSEFIEKHKILPDLMAAKTWDVRDDLVTYDDKKYNQVTNVWVREVKLPKTPTPSMQEAYTAFRKVVIADIDKDTGMIVISAEHVSPYVAKNWVSWLVEDINQTMKERDVQEAIRSSQFLMKQLEETKVADIRSVLYKLIEEQTKTIMFANVREEYAFKTIDPAFVPEEHSKPKRILIIILGFLFGGMLSILFVFIRYYMNAGKSQE